MNIRPGFGKAERSIATYKLEFSESSNRKVRVSARIPLHGETLLMYPEGAENFPNQWATFVQDLNARLPNGTSVQLEYVGNAQWKITPPIPEHLDLEYTVLINHDLSPEKWKFGYKQAAFARSNYVFCTGKALFIGPPDLEDIQVQFDVPDTWRVHTGWDSRTGQPNSFYIHGLTDLTEMAIVVGQPVERLIDVDGLKATLVGGNAMAASLKLMADNSLSFITAATKYFGSAPSSKILIVADFDPAYVGGGEAFTRSICLVFNKLPNSNDKAIWENIINHEILHLWIGNSIRFREGQQEYWFNEGFTEYVNNILATNLEYITEDELLKRLASHYEKYTARSGNISPREAGDDKAGNYDLVYSGGLIIAFAMDVEIRTRTHFEKGIKDLLKEMYLKFGTTDKRFTAGDVANLASTITDSEMNEFFKRYVHGNDVISLKQYASPLGIGVQTGQNNEKHKLTLTREPANSEEIWQYRKWIGFPTIEAT